MDEMDRGKKMKLMVKEQLDLEISTPPEFGGPEGRLSPQDLFVASASTRYVTPFFQQTAKDENGEKD
jgi:organic hydroperoxide reductase OsmC/OhrA